MLNMLARGTVLLLALTASKVPAATQTSDPAFIIGVSSHLLHRKDRSGPLANGLIRDAGIVSVRDDVNWGYVERTRNRLELPSHWLPYLEGVERYSLRSMFMLGYGNQFYGNTKPRNDLVRAAYGRYVSYMVSRLKGRTEFYEIWNEWDAEAPRDAEHAREYVRLVRDVVPRIRAADPKAKILAGSVTNAGIKGGFLQRLIENGVPNLVDGLSLHPYVHCEGPANRTPEGWIKWLGELDAGITRLAGRPVPLYLTEMSWPANRGACGISEELQAAYLARSYFLARTIPNIKGMWWYDIYNDGLNPQDREHNFGLLDYDMRPKAAYRVLKSISTIVKHYEYKGTVPTTVQNLVLLRFQRADDQVLVAWSTALDRSVSLSTTLSPGSRVRLIDTAQPTRGRFDSTTAWDCSKAPYCTASLQLGHFPKIISLGQPRSPESLSIDLAITPER